MQRQFRFRYGGTWTRWFNDEEDLSLLRRFDVNAIEVLEMMTPKMFEQQHPEFAAQIAREIKA